MTASSWFSLLSSNLSSSTSSSLYSDSTSDDTDSGSGTDLFSSLLSEQLDSTASVDGDSIDEIMDQASQNVSSRLQISSTVIEWLRERLSNDSDESGQSVSAFDDLLGWFGQTGQDMVDSLLEILYGQTTSQASSTIDGLSSARAWAQEVSGSADVSVQSIETLYQGSVQIQTIQVELTVEQAEELMSANSDQEWGGTIQFTSTEVSVTVTLTYIDPIVLDLEGDGLDLLSVDEGVSFDMTGTGESQQTGFISGDDALLFLDENGNGLLDDGNELFGDQDGYTDGFAELASYDDNQDGVIDAQDSVYANLQVYQDLNGDGLCSTDEVQTLAEAGVEAIFLNATQVDEEDESGNKISAVSSFLTSDGEVGQVADVLFAVQTEDGGAESDAVIS